MTEKIENVTEIGIKLHVIMLSKTSYTNRSVI